MKRKAIRFLYNFFPRSSIALAIIELFILVSAYTIGLALHIDSSSDSLTVGIQFIIAILFALIIVAIMMAIGLYWWNENNKISHLIGVPVSFAVALGLLALSTQFFFSSNAFSFDSDIFLIVTGLSFIGVVAIRGVFYLIRSQDFMRQRFLVIGAGRKAAALQERAIRDVKLVGFVPFDEHEVLVPENKIILKSQNQLAKITRSNEADTIVVALDEMRRVLPLESLLECKMNGINIIPTTEFSEKYSKRINLDDLNYSSIIFSNGFRSAIVRSKRKRCFDIIVSTLLLIPASLFIIPLVALAIKLSQDKGDIFYTQERVGKDDINFTMLKFRTMVSDAEKNGAQYASKDDNRYIKLGEFKLGEFLRTYRLDEIPQLINVLRGDMSFVGVRPERPEFVAKLEQKIPFYRLRHRIKPGITGWAQISYDYTDDFAGARKKLEYDLYYIKYYSLLRDIYILMHTVYAIVRNKGGR